jgi:hypothetical protein
VIFLFCFLLPSPLQLVAVFLIQCPAYNHLTIACCNYTHTHIISYSIYIFLEQECPASYPHAKKIGLLHHYNYHVCQPSEFPFAHLPGLILRSTALSGIYTSTPTIPPTKIPISPVPARAMGPVYQVCFIHGTMIPKPHKKASTAAMPVGKPAALFHCATSYAAQRLRKTKCSARTIKVKMVDQYPITPKMWINAID